MEKKASTKFIRQFFIWSGGLLLLCILAVVVFAPLFPVSQAVKGIKGGADG